MSRIEDDGFGPIQIAAGALWGPQTERSLQHFQISFERMPTEFIKALARVKCASVHSNQKLGLLPQDRARVLVIAAEEVMAGLHHGEFPLSIWQTGSATQTNMNMNEVLANRGIQLLGGEVGNYRLIHPNDDVNLGQSSNDVIPTAMHVAWVCQLNELLLPALKKLILAFEVKAKAFGPIIKVGRTHLQDAVPISLGAEFSGYGAQLRLAQNAIEGAMPALCELAIGGTAVGTGMNTHPEFGLRVAKELRSMTGYPFVPVQNKYAAIAAHEAMVSMHGALKTLATALIKISNDIRWLASGPRAGLGEIELPANEPGSSIMPGKVNPTQCEAVSMLCCQVLGNDVAIGVGGSQGNFELNAYKPLILHNGLQSIRLLGDGMNSFREHCVEGILVRESQIKALLNQSLMIATALSPHIGYEKAAQIAKLAHRENSSVREAAIKTQWVTGEQFDQWVKIEEMVPTGDGHE